MKKHLRLNLFLLCAFFTGFTAIGQSVDVWTLKNNSKVSFQSEIPVSTAKYYSLQLNKIQQPLKTVSKSVTKEISIPYPDGSFGTFELEEIQTMSDVLAAKYPQIKTYSGRNIFTGEVIRMDITPKGLHAMVFSRKGHFFIDPVSKTDDHEYQVYYKKDLLQTGKLQFEETEPIIYSPQNAAAVEQNVQNRTVEKPSGTQLRTYRIAIAATGEYTQFHGGSAADGLAAIVTTLNRVNGIYERDIAVRMVLVENNDLIIFTNPDTDPFTNNSASSMLNELQTEIDGSIGNSNYDIGHGFSTGAGGLAGLGVVCDNSYKARGVTGTSQPIGDPFDVDYVAHEIGHQFGAPHTFNGVVGSCSGGNRNGATAFEPGSGSTIMAYAGICGSDNLQNNSDAYFHVSSLEYMHAYTQVNGGNSCPEVTETGNNLPTVDAGTGGFTIPISTPFQLNGSASDPDGDALSLVWEEFDLGPASSLESPSGNAPIFRSFLPGPDTFRIFPRLSDILAGTQSKGELLPTYTRDLTFRFVARDNKPIAGVEYDEIAFSATQDAGPFLVNAIEGEYQGASQLTVSWDVANTDIAPVNCQSVHIYLSTDGGLHFNELLKANTPNDGIEAVQLPNISTENARIKVSAANNIFFNITPTEFRVVEGPSYNFSTAFTAENFCPRDAIEVLIFTESLLGYSEPISFSTANLPQGFTASFRENNINPGDTTILTLTNTAERVGPYNFDILASSGTIDKSENLSFIVQNVPGPPSFLAPAQNATAVSITPIISWEDQNILTSYELDIAKDASFSEIVESANNIKTFEYAVTNNLEGLTTYHIRLRASNSCGISNYAQLEFTTEEIKCTAYQDYYLPISIPDTPATVTSSIFVGESGEINELQIKNLRGTHSFVEDLTISLEGPDGTVAVLFQNICGGSEDFMLSFSEQSDRSIIDCPPTTASTYRPRDAFSIFNGKNIQGEWKLIVEDLNTGNGGQLNGWELNFCVSNPQFPELAAPSHLSAIEESFNKVSLTWTDNATNETNYLVERLEDGQVFFEVLAVLTENTIEYIDSTINESTQYTYRVKALLNSFSSASSNEATITTQAGIPEAPTNLEVNYVEDGLIRLSWQDNAINEDAYVIERSNTSENKFVIAGSVDPDLTTFEEVLPSFTETFVYRVYAENERGKSEFSNQVLASIAILGETKELDEQIKIFPNPARNTLHIKNSGSSPVERIILRNALGQTVKDLNGDIESVDVTSLPSGLYLLKIYRGDIQMSKKVIILR